MKNVRGESPRTFFISVWTRSCGAGARLGAQAEGGLERVVVGRVAAVDRIGDHVALDDLKLVGDEDVVDRLGARLHPSAEVVEGVVDLRRLDAGVDVGEVDAGELLELAVEHPDRAAAGLALKSPISTVGSARSSLKRSI